MGRYHRFRAALWLALLLPLELTAECPAHDSAGGVLESPSLILATLNIAHGRADALNQMLLSRETIEQNLALASLQLRDTGADIIALQEADASSRWSGKFNHVNHVADIAGYPCNFHGLHDDSSMSRYGTALLSRHDLLDARSIRFSPSWPTKPKGFVMAQLRWNPGGLLPQPLALTVVSVHLDFSRDSVRLKQIAEMISELTGIGGPLVVMGDFNADWHGEASATRRLAEALNLHAWEPEARGPSTFVGKERRLDWILVSRDLQFLRHEVLPEPVSDHLTVVAEVVLGARV